MKKHEPIKRKFLSRYPRLRKVFLKRGASSIDVNLLSMISLFNAIEKRKDRDNSKIKERLDKSRTVALSYFEHIQEEHTLSEIQQAAVGRAIDRLKNKFSKEGVVEAYNVTCQLKF
ncbi:MAG: hypothetical protein HON47_00765 [Candidatus Diapherotrites archaeon]|jgi:hypothetical protein|uniref:Uncharacterized protein n=1 Tax=Candidatus Iainarchaeum sp. TaxID=3101447 RepID=A0A8T5GDQ2_9ARCH|nr:hypothetical protein [Candidatus Diapherotrites archaeon]MBT7240903.1 hypothetical protein [Candidatus Diapherotrites archaeon]